MELGALGNVLCPQHQPRPDTRIILYTRQKGVKQTNRLCFFVFSFELK